MRLQSLVSLGLLGVCLTSPAFGQARVLDEGVFVVFKSGAPARTESFKISRTEGSITATASVTMGTQQISSLLTTDTIGSPIDYELRVKDKGARVVDLKARARAGRLSSLATMQAGDESMREYPLTPGKSILLEPGLLHHFYFVTLGRGPGSYQLIEPQPARSANATLSAKGLEPIDVGGRSVTATHYSLASGTTRYEFWVDARGRLLRVDAPAEGLSATREELPR